MATANSNTTLTWDDLSPQEQVLLTYYRLAHPEGKQALSAIAQSFNPPRSTPVEEVNHA